MLYSNTRNTLRISQTNFSSQTKLFPRNILLNRQIKMKYLSCDWIDHVRRKLCSVLYSSRFYTPHYNVPSTDFHVEECWENLSHTPHSSKQGHERNARVSIESTYVECFCTSLLFHVLWEQFPLQDTLFRWCGFCVMAAHHFCAEDVVWQGKWENEFSFEFSLYVRVFSCRKSPIEDLNFIRRLFCYFLQIV